MVDSFNDSNDLIIVEKGQDELEADNLSPTQKMAYQTVRREGLQSLVKASEFVLAIPKNANQKPMSLTAWKTFHILLSIAQEDAFTGKSYTIPRAKLRRICKTDERLDSALEELSTKQFKIMGKGPRARKGTGTIRMLGDRFEEETGQDDDLLFFQFGESFNKLINSSDLWAKLSSTIVLNFKSAFSVRLYEIGCQFYQRRNYTMSLSVQELRDLLHVKNGAYPDWGQLKRRVLKVAMDEVDPIAPFNIAIPDDKIVKEGRKVTHLTIVFRPKTGVEAAAAQIEMGSHSAGRKARLSGAVEEVVDEGEGWKALGDASKTPSPVQKAIDFGVAEKAAENALKRFGPDGMSDILAYVEEIILRKEQTEQAIQDIPAYVAKALKEGFGLKTDAARAQEAAVAAEAKEYLEQKKKQKARSQKLKEIEQESRQRHKREGLEAVLALSVDETDKYRAIFAQEMPAFSDFTVATNNTVFEGWLAERLIGSEEDMLAKVAKEHDFDLTEVIN